MKRIFSLLLIITAATCAFARVSGVVLDDKGETLVGANVYWANTAKGTITDLDGKFQLDPVKTTNLLVVSYMGYHNDTTEVKSHESLTIVLVSDLILDEVTITERKLGVIKSRTSAFDVQNLGAAELCKAACCNLSESFETSASVDVAYSDAATGAKQIRLLGLSGTYVQLLGENCPAVRGLAQNFGMEYIPGPWMESIQVSKGTSSVINGYEAITGQINVEYLKPQTCDPVSVNLMINSEAHAELNVEGGWQIPLPDDDDEEHEHGHEGHHHEHGEECHHEPTLHTGLLLHVQNGSLAMDDNKDGFLDMPINQNYNLMNRWYYKTEDYTFQFLVRGLYDRRQGGQRQSLHGKKHGVVLPDDPFLIDLRTYRIDGFMKNGYVFDHESGMSLGVITSASYHNQANTYGPRQWNASQTNANLNAIFQNSWEGEGLWDMDHKLSTGVSLNYDRYNEQLFTRQGFDTLDLSRWEVTPGIFAEYSYKMEDNLSLVAGVRLDYSTLYRKAFVTPRLNIRYSPWEWWTVRGSVGLGYRSPNIIADNASFLASNRAMAGVFTPAQEQSLNAGVSTTFYIPIGSRELQLSGEYYYTNFYNCAVADMDSSRHHVNFFNLRDVKGARAFSHNAQVEATMEILRGWTLTAAFRYTDVQQTTWNNALGDYALRAKPLTNKFKGIITTSYQTPLKKWQFDLTAQFNGGGRMPDGFNDFFISQLDSKQYYEKNGELYYKWYPQLMGQITKYWRTCSLYLGAENMTNFRQDSPVVGDRDAQGLVMADNQNFDASMAWGPITGWKVYLGFRWSLGKEED